jgi:hypothetical protein
MLYSIIIYLFENSTAQKPITKLARVRRKNNKTRTNKIKNEAVYTSIIIPFMTDFSVFIL